MSDFVSGDGTVVPGESWNGGKPISAAPARMSTLKWAVVCLLFAVAVVGVLLAIRLTNTTYGLWENNATPKVASSSATAGVELGLKFQTAVSGKISGVRFYKGQQNTGTHTGSLWDKNGNKLAGVTFINETKDGWQTAHFKQPVSIAGNVTYVISYYAPHGHNSVTTNYFNKSFTNKRITALNEGWDGGNGVFGFGTKSAFPLHASGASNYWVEPLFTSKLFGAKITPSAPVGFQAVPQKKSVVLAWLPSVSSTPIKQYDIYRNGELIKSIQNTSPGATTSYHQARSIAADIASLTSANTEELHVTLNGVRVGLSANINVNSNSNNTATGDNQSSGTSTQNTVNTSDTTNDSSTTNTPSTSTGNVNGTGTTTPATTATSSDPSTTTVNNSANNTASGDNESNGTSSSEHFTYTDTSVTPGQTYKYKIQAVDTSNKPSDVTETEATVPAAGKTPTAVPSSTSSNGGTTINVDNTNTSTATGPNESNSGTTTTVVDNTGTTTTTTPSTTPSTSTTPSSGTGNSKSGTTTPTTTPTIPAIPSTGVTMPTHSSTSPIWQYTNDTTNWNTYFKDYSNYNINDYSGSTNITNNNSGQNTSTTYHSSNGTTTIQNNSTSTAH